MFNENVEGGHRARLPYLVAGSRTYWSRRSTFWSDCEASDRALVDRLWRVWRARRFAASSLLSAKVRFDAPVCSVLIRALVKSWRVCTIDRFEPKLDASDRSVSVAVLRLLRIVVMPALV